MATLPTHSILCAQVQSSVLASAAYHPDAALLDVVLRNGSRYRYFNVPRVVYAQLLAADSKGRFFNAHIKGAFRYQRF